MIVIAIIGILAAVAVPMYGEYTKRARTTEIPFILRVIVQQQISRMHDPAIGLFATAIETLEWRTSSGDTAGTFYQYGTSGVPTCDPGSGETPEPEGLAEAVALDFDEVPGDWRAACMDHALTLLSNSM